MEDCAVSLHPVAEGSFTGIENTDLSRLLFNLIYLFTYVYLLMFIYAEGTHHSLQCSVHGHVKRYACMMLGEFEEQKAKRATLSLMSDDRILCETPRKNQDHCSSTLPSLFIFVTGFFFKDCTG